MLPHLPPAAVDALGYAAGTLTTLAFIPQVVKTWRSGSASDLSATMLAAFTGGVLLWLVYGVAVGSLPVVVANGVTLTLSGVLLFLRLRHAVRPRRGDRRES